MSKENNKLTWKWIAGGAISLVLISGGVAWTMLNDKIDQKADKATTKISFDYVERDIDDVKDDIRDIKESIAKQEDMTKEVLFRLRDR